MKKDSFLSKITSIYTMLGFSLIVIAIGLVVTPIAPYIIYRLSPSETTNEVNKISETINNSNVDAQNNTQIDYQPELDLSLPDTPYIVIPSIGVYSPISTISDYTEALKHGAWMVPDFGTPINGISPIIVAAHRFGYISWGTTIRNKISFYNLPKTKVGDTIQIIWGRREYSYKIYNAAEGTAITDYSADLILYTCKYFNSPQRIFRYASLITP